MKETADPSDEHRPRDDTKEKRRAAIAARLFVPAWCAGKRCLEEEAEADFHLTGGIGEVGVGVGDFAKRRAVVKARRSGSASDYPACRRGRSGGCDAVRGINDPGCVDMIKEIVCLPHYFSGVSFAEIELLREAEV